MSPPADDKDNNPVLDEDQDEHTRPGIPRPGQQPDQQQQPNAPPQPRNPPRPSARGGINPDLDPAGMHSNQRIDLRDQNPLTPQGMLFDPRQLIDYDQRHRDPSRPDAGIPPGARFDPFGPPDPSQVGPGRGPAPSSGFAGPDPDHFQPPGQPGLPPLFRGKNVKQPWPPGGGGFPPPGGAGGGPFI